jgi:8-oxo-dGTP pyrophosphatase MutT (NUDIX family)
MTVRAWIYKLAYPIAKIYWRIFKPKARGAFAVIKNGNDLLLVKNTYGSGYWSFPGGTMKKGESQMDVVKREILEEVGIKLDRTNELGSFPYNNHGREETIYVFGAEINERVVKIDPNEILEYKWVPELKINELKLSNVGANIFEIYKK